jgi:hypothetical protein
MVRRGGRGFVVEVRCFVSIVRLQSGMGTAAA